MFLIVIVTSAQWSAVGNLVNSLGIVALAVLLPAASALQRAHKMSELRIQNLRRGQ